MNEFLALLPEPYTSCITLIVTICAALAIILPAPKTGSNGLYRAIYSFIQWNALNVGKAKNAQDAKVTYVLRK